MNENKQEIIANLKSKEIESINFVISNMKQDGRISIVGNIKTLRILGYEDPDYLYTKTPEEKKKEAEEKKKEKVKNNEKKAQKKS